MASLQRFPIQQIVPNREGNRKIVIGYLYIRLGLDGFHLQGFDLCRANILTIATPLAIQRVDLYSEIQALQRFAHRRYHFKRTRRFFQFLVGGKVRYDGGMGTDEGTLITLNAIVFYPFRNTHGHSPFFIFGSTDREETVRFKCTHRKIVAFLNEHWPHHILDKHGLVWSGLIRNFGNFPGLRTVNFTNVFNGLVHRIKIHLDDRITFATVYFPDLFLQQPDRFFNGQHLGQVKKRCLHNHVDPAAQANFRGNLDSVHIVKFQLFLGDASAHLRRDLFVHVLCRPRGVQEKDSPVPDTI